MTTDHHATLQKTLGLRSAVLFGLAYMTPIIVLGIFGVIAKASDGASAGASTLATVAMLFTALSYGVMARHFPVAGSAYTYVRKALDSRLGFIVGWAIRLDYLFLPLVILAAVARLLYAMGRDGVLPKRVFGWLSERFHTPVFNIALAGLIGIGAVFLDITTSTSFIHFGAFNAFTLVSLSVIGYFLRHRTERLNPWRHILIPAVGAAVDVYLLTQLDSRALILGASWLGIGIVYLLVLTGGLTRERPTWKASQKRRDPIDACTMPA